MSRIKAKKTQKADRIREIAEYLMQGFDRKEIIQFCAKKYGVGERIVDTDIRSAKTIVAERNAELERVRMDEMSAAKKKAVNEAIITNTEIEAVLCTIIMANLQVEEIVRGEAIIRNVNPMEQIAAADKIFKIRGAYAATKTEISVAKPVIIKWNKPK